MRPLAAITALVLLSAAPAVGTQSLSLNGVPIDGVVSQRFENATVVIDERGNVNILAPGYAVEVTAQAAAPPALAPPPGPRTAAPPSSAAQAADDRGAPAAGRLEKRYFVVAVQAEAGASGYDVAVFLNGRWVREVRSDASAEPFEVTRFLQPGKNRVQLVATKRPGTGPGTPSREATLRVAIGEAPAAGAPLADPPLVQMTRSAAETETFTEEHTLIAR
jgi:hypothetical protein